jgi:methyl-accepting chemotaxis protein
MKVFRSLWWKVFGCFLLLTMLYMGTSFYKQSQLRDIATLAAEDLPLMDELTMMQDVNLLLNEIGGHVDRFYVVGYDKEYDLAIEEIDQISAILKDRGSDSAEDLMLLEAVMNIGKKIKETSRTDSASVVNERIVSIYAFLKDSHDMVDSRIQGATISMRHSAQKQLALTSAIARDTQIMIAVLTAISIGIGIWLTTAIVRPINTLRDAARRIGHGELEQGIEIETGDEIGDLAKSFNDMLIDLNSSNRQVKTYGRTLEKEVAKRTRELEEKATDLEKFNKIALTRELRIVELKRKLRELERRGHA